MFDAACHFAGSLNYSPHPFWITFAGPSGVGKTKLARGIYDQFMADNRFVTREVRGRIVGNTGRYADWRKICRDLREGAWGQIDDLCDEWFVVLDDIGAEYDPNGFIASALDRVCNSRLGKWTVITTNIPMNQIAKRLDERIASRMQRDRNIVIDCTAPDFSSWGKI